MLGATDRTILVIQGEHAVSGEPDVMISTLLGSCVAACLWDETNGVGGLNHIVLSPRPNDIAMGNFAGVNAMELLINDIVKCGGDRRRLQAKVFGGARMVKGLSDVGQRNSEFVQDFLSKENIPCVSASVGGTTARKIQFWPSTGRARQLMVGNVSFGEPVIVAPPSPGSDDIELF